MNSLREFQKSLAGTNCQLIAVSKTKPVEDIKEAYDSGHRDFGENKIQELVKKYEVLPKDIKWHMIGHLQRNKVKYIAPFVELIHSVDSLRLLGEIEKQGKKVNRTIKCLLQIHIAKEETKFGLNENELFDLLESTEFKDMSFIKIKGLMGMATNTKNKSQIREEFKELYQLFQKMKGKYNHPNIDMEDLSMGMTSDYAIAIEEGSTMIRVGSAIFGERNYQNPI